MSYMLKTKCHWCGDEFLAQRKSAKFCSDTCRIANHRYNPSEIIQTSKQGMIENMNRTLDILRRRPDTIVEIDKMLMEVRNQIEQWQRENYKKVLDEESRRLF